MEATTTATMASKGPDGNHTPKASRRSPTIRFAELSKPILPAPATVSPIGSTSSSGRIHSEVRRSFLEKPGDEPPSSTILDTFPDRLPHDPPRVAANLAIDTMHVPRYVTPGIPIPTSPNGKRSEASSQEVRIHQNHVVNPVQVEVHVNPMVVNPEQATLYSDETDEEDDNIPLVSNRLAQNAQHQASHSVSPVVTPDEPLVNLVNRLKISSNSSQTTNQQSTTSPIGTPNSAGPLKGGLLSPTNYSKEIDSKRKQFSLPLGPPSPMSPETPDIDDLPLASMASTNRGLMTDQEHMRLMMMGLSMGMGLGMSMSGTVPPGFPGYSMPYPGMPVAPTPFGYPQAPPPGIYPYPVHSGYSEPGISSSKSSKKKHKKEPRKRSASKSSRSSSKSRSRSRRREKADDDEDDDVPIRELDRDPRGRSATRKKQQPSDAATTNAVPANAVPSAIGQSPDESSSTSQGNAQTVSPLVANQGPGNLSLSPVLSSSSTRVREDWQPNSPTREQLVKSRAVRDRLSPSAQSSNPFDSKKNV